MSAIVLIDTSIYLNILDVPGRNQQRSAVLEQFEQRIKAADHLLLPAASIWETGNHISRLANGALRRRFAAIFVANVCSAIAGETPYGPTQFPSGKEFADWLQNLPESAQRNKSATKTNEGVSLSDHTIIKEWELGSGNRRSDAIRCLGY
jgi:hypothetical protein